MHFHLLSDHAHYIYHVEMSGSKDLQKAFLATRYGQADDDVNGINTINISL